MVFSFANGAVFAASPIMAESPVNSRNRRDLVVIGGSAGAIHVLTEIVRGLPPDFPGAIVVVVHTSAGGPGLLASLLDRAGPLTAVTACDGQRIHDGFIYVAPPDHHVLIEKNRLHLTRGPKENGFRPAIDPLFRTAANEYGPRTIGVVLSGGLNDGSKGMLAIKRHGGVSIVQEPAEAVVPSMPQSAIMYDHVDHVVSYAEIAAIIMKLTSEPIHNASSHVRSNHKTGNGDRDIAERGTEALRTDEYDKPPSKYTCPECGGALWELHDEKLVHYRCHVGHGYTAEALAEFQDESLESALWSAVRGLEEHAALNRQLARQSSSRWPLLQDKYDKRAEIAEERARVIRDVLVRKTFPTAQFPAAVKTQRAIHRSKTKKAMKDRPRRNLVSHDGDRKMKDRAAKER